MGNTLSEERTGTEIYRPINEEDAPLLRKKIHDILMNSKQTINGREIDVNRRKMFCRVSTKADGPEGDMSMKKGEYINLALPGITNIVPDFIYHDNASEGNIKPTSKIQTFDIPLRINEIEPKGKKGEDYQYNNVDNNGNTITQIQRDLYNPTEISCTEDVKDICAKQLYDNKCVIMDMGKFTLSSAKRCYKNSKDKLEKSKVNIEKDKDILKQIVLEENIVINNDYYCKFLQMGSETTEYDINGTKLNINIDIRNQELWSAPNGKYYNKLNKDGALGIFGHHDFINIAKNTNNVKPTYIKMRNMIIINYIYRNENFYKTDLYSDKVVYTGEPVCACANSVYGKNFNTFPSTKCNIKTEEGDDGNYNYLIEILNNPNDNEDWLINEARNCLQWEAKFLTNYNEILEITDVKGEWMTPSQCEQFKQKWDNFGLRVSRTDKNTRQVIKLLREQREKCNYRQNLRVNMYRNLSTADEDWPNNGSKYSIKLDGMGLKEKDVKPYENDKLCKDKVLTQKGTEQPPYYVESREGSETTCINTIQFNNVNADNINIGSILQNNVCGNIGNVRQFFITPQTGKQSYSNCPGGINAGLFLSGFNVNIKGNGSLDYDIFSNINGYYKKHITEADSERVLYTSTINKDIILELKIYEGTNNSAFMIHHISSGLPIARLSSRKFAYNQDSNTEGDNEEMCIDKTMRNIYIYSLYLQTISPSEQRQQLEAFINKNEYNNVINPTHNQNDIINNFQTYITNIPDYSWSVEAQIDGTNVESNIGIISHGGTSLFETGTRFFNTNVMNSSNIVNHFYLYETTGNSSDVITGRGKFMYENDTLTPYLILGDFAEEIVDWHEDDDVYQELPGQSQELDDLIDKPKSLVLSGLLSKIKKLQRGLLIYSPCLYRYLLIKGNNLVGASNISYDNFIGNEGEKLIIKQSNLDGILDSLLPSYLHKTSGDKEWTMVNIQTINDNMGELYRQKVKKFQIAPYMGNIKLITMEEDDRYLYRADDNSIVLKLHNNRWNFYQNMALKTNSEEADLDLITQYANKVIGKNDYWKSDIGKIEIKPVVSFNLRFTIRRNIINNQPQNDRTKEITIENKLKNIISEYFETSAQYITSLSGISKKFAISDKTNLFMWFSVDVQNLVSLEEEKKRNINTFITHISNLDIDYIVISDKESEQTILEISPVINYPGSKFNNELVINDRANNTVNHNSSTVFNIFNKGVSNVYKYDINFQRVGNFRIKVNRQVTNIYPIIKNGMLTMNNLPFTVTKINTVTVNPNSDNIEGFNNNYRNYNYKEYLDNVEETYQITYFYDNNTSFKSSNQDKEIGPISRSIQYKNIDGSYSESKLSLGKNETTPVGTIINVILTELREINPDTEIIVLTEELDGSTKVYKVLYDSSTDLTGEKIKKLSIKETIEKIYNEYTIIKNNLDNETLETRKKYRNISFNGAIIGLIRNTKNLIANTIADEEQKIYDIVNYTIPQLIELPSSNPIFNNIILGDYISLPNKLSQQINYYKTELELEIDFYNSEIRANELLNKYGQQYNTRINKDCNDVESCNQLELQILQQLIREKLNKEPVCSTIEACRLELAPKPSLPESPIVALKDSSNKVMISIIIIVIILITIISGYVMLKN